MATITVEFPAVAKRLTLDQAQTDMFMEEFRRVSRRSLWDRLVALFSRGSPASAAPPIAPELIVKLEEGGQVDTYEIGGRFVLSEPGGVEPRQFYFALLLFEWLEQAGSSSAPTAP